MIAAIMLHRRHLLPLVLVWALFPATVGIDGAAAADGDPPPRPRIGVAFGGGGARGAAHVGVIRVLEELDIEVDCVAGTSMGAIVGALYAIGMSADEIEAELNGVDWVDLFSDRIPRRGRTMRRKADDDESFFPFEFGLAKHGLAAPRGFIAGQKFAFAFDAPALITAGHASFDNLPIPYRAIATDLETGQKVVLDRGNLIRAVRASMSIPGVFPPVEWQGRLLVDGFLASNVPVDVVREMGADIVIAIDVGRSPEAMTREELQSIAGIRRQVARLRSALADQEEVARADIVIRPDVDQWNGQEYDQLPTIYGRGEAAARAAAAELATLSSAPAQWQAWRRQVAGHDAKPPLVDVLVLDNRSRVNDAVLLQTLDVEMDAPLDVDGLQQDLAEIYELGLFESIDFDLTRQDRFNVLTVTAHEKLYSPWLVHLGAAYSLAADGASRFQIQARINRREMNRRGAEWRTDVALGTIAGIRTEWYQPLDLRRHWFVVPALSASRRESGLYLENQSLAQVKTRRLEASLGGGVALARSAEVRVEAFAAHLRTDPASGFVVGFPPASNEASGPRFGGLIDTLDDHRVPLRGLGVKGNYERPSGWLGTDLEYDRLWGSFLGAATMGRSTFQFNVEGGTDLGSGMPGNQQFFLGGLRRLSGYRDKTLRGNAFGLATVGWLYRLGGSELPFANRWYLGVWAEAGNTWFDSRNAAFDDLLYCGALTVVADTIIGPLQFGYGRAADGNDTVHLEFGIHLGTPSN